jgi:hypothetical protein
MASPIDCSFKYWEQKRKNTFRENSLGDWEDEGRKNVEEADDERRASEGGMREEKKGEEQGWRLSLNSKLYRKRKESICVDK